MPASRTSSDTRIFNRLYADVDPDVRQSLLAFRREHAAQPFNLDGFTWYYTSFGEGDETALFLPGAAGAYDIFWQQQLALANHLRVISVSYPPIANLDTMLRGLNGILDRASVFSTHIIGTSMGGYLAQYFASRQPERVRSAVLSNTFVPTMPVLRTASILRLAILMLPITGLLFAFRSLALRRLVPAGEGSPLLQAYLLEASCSGFGKADILARLACIRQPFVALTQHLPILIIDSENDPLIRPSIRGELRRLYPAAEQHTFPTAGHFPYLHQPAVFTDILRSFIVDG